jgi:hypothetical protein
MDNMVVRIYDNRDQDSKSQEEIIADYEKGIY